MYVPSQATKDESVSGETNVTTRPVAGSAWRSPYLSRKYSFPLQPVKVVAASRNASDPTPSGLAGLTIRPARKVDFSEGVVPSETGWAGAPDPGSEPAGLNSSALAEPAPPAANILFVFRRTLAKHSRRSFIRSTVVHVPLAGSNDSVLSKGSPKVDDGLPPMTRTLPSRRTTAVCQTRPSVIEPVFAQLPFAGSKISAVRPPPPPPATNTFPSGRVVAVWPDRATFRLPVRTHVIVEGSKSRLVESKPLGVRPPVTSTLPFASSVALCPFLRAGIGGSSVQEIVLGSKSSAEASGGAPPPASPPATRTLPLGSSVAECPCLAFCIEGTAVQFLVEGSYSSAVAVTLPVTPPVTRTFPLASSVAV